MNESNNSTDAYVNPVYGYSCPDPFVLKHCGEYWCYSTGFWKDGRCFGVLHSRDLVHWRELAGAMEPLPGGATCYWAPEVFYDNGLFYMYYSVGNEEFMQVRVAVSQGPAGPFIDSGRRLTNEQFAIDAHVFQDDDGARYMFYATDFLDHTHIGTGTVIDRMLDPFTLSGSPRPVTRARFDWQVYDPHRIEKGGVRWHTVEGPFVLKHKSRYYQMFSGGNWKNMSYGVSYAVTNDIKDRDEWSQVSDGERIMPVLRTIPGSVIGPGHNSVVRGPDNRQLFCVYHRWDEQSSARVLCIDRQEWAGDRIIVIGPTCTPQDSPLQPSVSGFAGYEGEARLGDEWECAGGRWVAREGAVLQETDVPRARASCKVDARCFITEVSLRSLHPDYDDGQVGVNIAGDREDALRFSIPFPEKKAIISWRTETGWVDRAFDLPEEFRPHAYHLLRVEVDDGFACVALDGIELWGGRMIARPAGVALETRNAAAAFAGFALTEGWQDLFTREAVDPAETGWERLNTAGRWEIRDQQLCYSVAEYQTGDEARAGIIAKGTPFESYELVVNARVDVYSEGDCYGFYPAMGAGGPGPLFTISRARDGWSLKCHESSEARSALLPDDFDPFAYQQFRFRKQRGELSVRWETRLLLSIETTREPARPGLYARGAGVKFDMARVTAITDNMRTTSNTAQGENGKHKTGTSTF